MANEQWKQLLNEKCDPDKVETFMRFFKTGKGEYGEGDIFIGLSVPNNRAISRTFHDTPLSDVDEMISEKIHEYRLAGFLALVERYRKTKSQEIRHHIARHYIGICHKADNWDLVDLSAPNIIGLELLAGRCTDDIRRLVKSDCLWERRVAVVSTLTPVMKKGDTALAFEMCHTLISDPHPLIRKAVGWVLRECGKKNRIELENFLRNHINEISAVTLSYSIEKFTPEERTYWRNLRKTP